MLSLAVITFDPHIVQQVNDLASQGTSVTIASDPAAAGELLGSYDRDALLIDLADASILPRPSLLPQITRGLLFICKGQKGPPQITVHDRSELPRVIERIRRMIATRTGCATDALLGGAPNIRQVRQQIRNVASFPGVSVLVLGETGTGKELVAKAIHDMSCGPDRPFVAINCAAIPESLLESELFGHQVGAFTGAKASRPGLLEAARHGTLFLDEIGEMPLALQPKLLRVLESRSFRRVGSNATIPFEARVVSATNRPASGANPSGLRPDLFYRLAGLKLPLPPLRERVEDIPLLAAHFLDAFAERNEVPPQPISDDAIDALKVHDWPGNARELRCIVEHAAILADGARVEEQQVLGALRSHSGRGSGTFPAAAVAAAPTHGTARAPLRAVEQGMIQEAFERHGGNVSRTAAELGISRSTLRDKLRRYGLLRSDESYGS